MGAVVQAGQVHTEVQMAPLGHTEVLLIREVVAPEVVVEVKDTTGTLTLSRIR